MTCALQARRAALLEAEALVHQFGSRGVETVETCSGDPSMSEARRAHCRRVARIAERRHPWITGLGVATRYGEMARWRHRRRNMIVGGHPPT